MVLDTDSFPDNEPQHDGCAASVSNEIVQRPNENLLRLGRLTDETSDQTTSINDTPSYDSVLKESEFTVKISVQSDEDVSQTKPPPSYDSVMKTSVDSSESQLPPYQEVGLDDAPPAYHTIFTGSVLMRAINALNTNNEDGSNPVTRETITQQAMPSIWFRILIPILFIFVLVLPISMIIVGIIFIHDCPVQPRIPIYLIVLGFFQMLECCGRVGYSFFKSHRNHQNSWRERYRRKDPLIYFVIVWFVIGSMWVYQTNPDCQNCDPVVNPFVNVTMLNSTISPHSTLRLDKVAVKRAAQGTVYCNGTVYTFAFWVITSYYGVIGFFCLLILVDVFARAVGRCCCS